MDCTTPKNPAIVFEGRNTFSIKKLQIPRLKPGEVLIETEACTICGSDLRMLKYGHRRAKYPIIAGHEVIGKIALSRNPRFKEGTYVLIHPRIVCGKCFYCLKKDFIHCMNTKSIGFDYPGGFSLYFKMPEKGIRDGNLIKLNRSAHIFTLSEPLACVIRVWEKITPSNRTLVVGDGPIGFLHAYLTANHNREVYIKVKTRYRERFLKKWGFTILKKPPSSEKEKFSEVILSASTKSAVKFALSSVRKGGRLISFSGIEGTGKALSIVNEIHYKELNVYGFHASTPEDMKKAIKFLKTHTELERLITHTFHYSEFPEALTTVESRTGMKVLIYFKK